MKKQPQKSQFKRNRNKFNRKASLRKYKHFKKHSSPTKIRCPFYQMIILRAMTTFHLWDQETKTSMCCPKGLRSLTLFRLNRIFPRGCIDHWDIASKTSETSLTPGQKPNITPRHPKTEMMTLDQEKDNLTTTQV